MAYKMEKRRLLVRQFSRETVGLRLSHTAAQQTIQNQTAIVVVFACSVCWLKEDATMCSWRRR